jgi:hypothetical protein
VRGEAVDADWIPKARNDDDNGENASTSMLVAASATKSRNDEAGKSDLMMIDEMEGKRREGSRSTLMIDVMLCYDLV